MTTPRRVGLSTEPLADRIEKRAIGESQVRTAAATKDPLRPDALLLHSLNGGASGRDALAPFSALGESKGGRCLLGPGWCDLEEFEDAALCVGEAVELDAGVCVGEAESLEDAEDVTSGGFR